MLLLSGNPSTFRELYKRNANTTLQNVQVQAHYFRQISPETCAEKCTKETTFQCRSFEINNQENICLLHDVDHTFVGVQRSHSPTNDYYEGEWVSHIS